MSISNFNTCLQSADEAEYGLMTYEMSTWNHRTVGLSSLFSTDVRQNFALR